MGDLFIDMGFAVLLRILKNNGQRSQWRTAFLKVFRAIATAYQTDPEFSSLVNTSQTKVS